MQSGSINQPPKQQVQRKQPQGAEVAKNQGQETAQAPDNQAVEQAPQEQAVPTEKVAFGAVMDVSPDALQVKDDGKGGYESEMTLAFVKKSDRERLEKEGAIFPEVGQAVLGDGIGADGSLEVVSNYDTENPISKNIGASIEVDKSLLEADETGARPIDSHRPIFLAA